MQRLSGPAEVQLLRDGDKITRLAEVDVVHPLLLP